MNVFEQVCKRLASIGTDDRDAVGLGGHLHAGRACRLDLHNGIFRNKRSVGSHCDPAAVDLNARKSNRMFSLDLLVDATTDEDTISANKAEPAARGDDAEVAAPPA